MLSLVETLASVGTAFTILSAGLYFIIKLLINKSFEAGIERYKMSLQQDLEAHKMNLQLNNFKSTKLYELQGEILKNIYKILYNYRTLFLSVFILLENREHKESEELATRFQALIDKSYELDFAYEENRIFFDTELSSSINTIIRLMFSVIAPLSKALAIRTKHMHHHLNSITASKNLPIDKISPEIESEFNDYLDKFKQDLENMDASLSVLADEFRKIYGLYKV